MEKLSFQGALNPFQLMGNSQDSGLVCSEIYEFCKKQEATEISHVTWSISLIAVYKCLPIKQLE